ncbi:MAG TPA: caspase family protein, partial [Geminicoccaceae bacterium]
MGGRRPICLLIFCLLLAAISSFADAAAQERRLALVIGNGAYGTGEPLSQPVSDAAEVAAALERLGFVVDLQTDLGQSGMEDALRAFGYAAPNAEVALVFFSGHGIEVDGVSYLLPVDAQLRRERDLIYEALPVDLVLEEAAQARGLGLVILDASRENPLAEGLRQTLGPIGAQRIVDGIGQIAEQPSETLVALSTRPGTTSIDGDGPTSIYVGALLTHLEEPGLELDFLFRQVRDSVLEATQRRQEPRTYDALGAEPFYFRERPNRPPVIAEIRPLEVLDNAGPTPLGLPLPSDPEGDRLVVEVTGLPERGVIRYGTRALEVGNRLEVAVLDQLSYEPDPGQAGDAGAFDFMVEDAEGASVGAMLPIVIKSSNRPPVVAARQILEVSAVPLNLQTPVDLDGDRMTVRVTALPEKGVVRDGGRIVKVGDELSPMALAGLMLVTEEGGAFGTFGFDVIDERGARSSARLDIALSTTFERGTGRPAGAGPSGPAVVRESPSAPAEQRVAARPTAPEPAPPEASEIVPEPAAPEASPAANGTVAETAPAGQEEPSAPLYRTTRLSNIRAEPRVEAKRVATVPADTVLKVTGQADGQNWYEVETEDGQTGFIYFALVQPVTISAVKAKLPLVRSSGEV